MSKGIMTAIMVAFAVYSWTLYHVAYAKGAFVEMMGNNRQLQACHNIITAK